MDMKEFWKQIEDDYTNPYTEKQEVIEGIKERQFVFLWDRGGKQFILNNKTTVKGVFRKIVRLNRFDDLKELAKNRIGKESAEWIAEIYLEAQDFLDCVAIDEDKVKELIKEME